MRRITRDIDFDDIMKGCLPPSMQMMVALRVFAADGFLSVVADTFGLSKATLSQSVHQVSVILARQLNEVLKFEHQADI